MDVEQVTRYRDLASKIGAALCVIALLALVDGLLVHFREPANVLKVLPGAVRQINGEMTGEARSIQELTFVSDADQLKVVFEAIHPGYFLGGDMWRGRLAVGPHLSPGEYSLTVLSKKAVSPRKAPTFRVVVYPDELSLRRSSASLFRRWLGFSAFVVAACSLPLILLAFGGVFLLSGARERLLAAGGQAEVYQVRRREGGLEIRFGLGTAQGLQPGSVVRISDPQGRTVGTAEVAVATRTDSLAVVPVDQEIKEGYLVSVPPV
jgi:hypothetical protein